MVVIDKYLLCCDRLVTPSYFVTKFVTKFMDPEKDNCDGIFFRE